MRQSVKEAGARLAEAQAAMRAAVADKVAAQAELKQVAAQAPGAPRGGVRGAGG